MPCARVFVCFYVYAWDTHAEGLFIHFTYEHQILGIDTDESRRRRGEFALSLRKSKRDEQLQKRRITTENKDENSENRSSNGNQFPVELSALPQITQALHSNDVSLQLQAATAIRKLLSIENNPPITEVI